MQTQTMTEYTATDLWTDIEPGVRFHTNAPFAGKGTLKVTAIDEGLGPNGRWTFNAEEIDDDVDDACEWQFVVLPARGGPNGGVVEAYWVGEDGERLGNHEIYPRAIDIATPNPETTSN